MNEELKLHIKRLQRRAVFSFVAILLSIISIGFGLLFLFALSFVAIIFFVIAAFCIVYLIHGSHTAKKEAKENVYKPVIFNADKDLTFEKVVSIFENLTNKENQLSTSENVRFFRLNKIFKLRTVIYRTENFNKKDFDNSKDRINKKANKALNISPWVNQMKAVNMMRFNIICTDVLNDALYQFLSQNANRNLTRVEGIINIAIIGNQIVIPPLYDECDLAEISRYKDVIKFINQVLLNGN